MEFNLSPDFAFIFSACHARDLQLNVEITDYISFVRSKYVQMYIICENNCKFQTIIIKCIIKLFLGKIIYIINMF